MNASGSNVARHLRIAAERTPDGPATKTPWTTDRSGSLTHLTRSFRELDGESDAAAEVFAEDGVVRGMRVLLAVRPGHDLIVCMFGLLKLGAIPVAIDPGMGWKSFLSCVRSSHPGAVVGIRRAIWLSRLPFSSFRSLRHRIKVGDETWGRRISAGMCAEPRPLTPLADEDLAAILFTSGSTGAPKGVRYTHGMFDAQIRLIRETYGISPGEVDMPMLPLFALFNPALGMTTVTPLLDPSRPARADPMPIVTALLSEQVTNSFGSPAVWGRIADHCVRNGIKLPSLRRLLIAGAPVPDGLLTQLQNIAPNCAIHTPYGATECLPATTIDAAELLDETRASTLMGAGTCVGRPVAGVEIRIIRETDTAIASLSDTMPCGPGEVGEIIVTGPSVTKEYDGLPEATRQAKIADGTRVWHRMGDLGTLDSAGRLRFLGRRVEKVRTTHGDLCTEAVEPAFRQHPHVARCALIGLGGIPQTPVLVVEPRARHFPGSGEERRVFALSLREKARDNAAASAVRSIVFQKSLPVDVRHNAKIHRLRLAREWTRRFEGKSLPNT